MPRYKLDIQVRIPIATSALHNFILHTADDDEDSESLADASDFVDPFNGTSGPESEEAAVRELDGENRDAMSVMRNQIAQSMWDDYQRRLAERAPGSEGSSSEDSDDDE
jgi:hypothetical protein